MAAALELEYTIVDAFTSRVFGGNPAAVIVLQPGQILPDATQQLLAREFNLSETAFVVPLDDGTYSLRWFTPAVEIPLCGHATLASAYRLFASAPEVNRVVFQTRWSGELVASRAGPAGQIELEFPAGVPETLPAVAQDAIVPAVQKILDASSTPAVYFIGGAPGPSFKGYLLVHVDESFDLAAAQVNSSSLATTTSPDYYIIILTQAGRDGVDFVSRVFAPATGVPEDPVTGSAHCMLAVYWTQRLGKEGTSLTARQVSARGGDLNVEWIRDLNVVRIRGEAVVAARGTVFVPREHA